MCENYVESVIEILQERCVGPDPKYTMEEKNDLAEYCGISEFFDLDIKEKTPKVFINMIGMKLITT